MPAALHPPPLNADPAPARAWRVRGWLMAALTVTMAGCASRAVDVRALPTSAEDFAAWPCPRIDEELDTVQQRAADLAYSVDERAGNNILALGIGAAVFWPALLAMRGDGPEAADLARLKGRFEALNEAARRAACPARADTLSPERVAALPVVVGERLVYEQRQSARHPARETVLQLVATRRAELEYRLEAETGGTWVQDLNGNVLRAPDGQLQWPHFLRGELSLGQVLAGDMQLVGDPFARARLRGQVVAVGPQALAGRRFDVAVIELFGDAPRGEASTRVDGALVVDRRSGVLLRLDLRSAEASFSLQRRLVRIEAAPR
jgi:hypothetical protein